MNVYVLGGGDDDIQRRRLGVVHIERRGLQSRSDI